MQRVINFDGPLKQNIDIERHEICYLTDFFRQVS